MTDRARVAVLASGSGTNLQALIDACAAPDFPAVIAVVGSNRPNAGALDRARAAGIPTELLTGKGFADRSAYDAALVGRLQAHRVDWVVLAGWMRLVTPAFLAGFPGRVLNIHPSLLPAFPGLNAPEQALSAGVRVTGCTVHFVDEGMDTGPIVAQAAVPVLPDDDVDTLSARIRAEEHRLYPRCLRWAVEGRLRVQGRQVRVSPAAGEPAARGEGTTSS